MTTAVNDSFKVLKIADVFGISAGTMECVAFADASNPLIPMAHAEYVFQKDTVRDVLAFLYRPRGDALWLSGPTGCGKTSVILEIAARLNWPVVQVTCHGSMEFAELRGQFVVESVKGSQNPVMRYRHGPLATAMKEGYLLLINEIDLMEPSELAGLNDVLEGRPLVIAENAGEVIVPHENFRVIVTANSNGAGDATGLYQGIQSQNLAAMDRYRTLLVDYPTADIEKKILAKVAPQLPAALHQKMVKLAKEIRSAFIGSDGTRGNLSVTMSTRTLVRWAQLSVDFLGAPNAVKEALNPSLLNRCTRDERVAIEELAKLVFGDDWIKADLDLSYKIKPKKPKSKSETV